MWSLRATPRFALTHTSILLHLPPHQITDLVFCLAFDRAGPAGTIGRYFPVPRGGAGPVALHPSRSCTAGRSLRDSDGAHKHNAAPAWNARCAFCFTNSKCLSAVSLFVSYSQQWTTGSEQQTHTENLFSDAYLPRYTRAFSNAIGKAGFFGGEHPSYADFLVFHVLNVCESLRPGGISALCPTLSSWMSRVETLPGVSEYLLKRPPLHTLGIHRQKKE